MRFRNKVTSIGDDCSYKFFWRPTAWSFASFPFISYCRPARAIDGDDFVSFQFGQAYWYFLKPRTFMVTTNVNQDFFSGSNNRMCVCWSTSIVIRNFLLWLVQPLAIDRVQSCKSRIFVICDDCVARTSKVAWCGHVGW